MSPAKNTTLKQQAQTMAVCTWAQIHRFSPMTANKHKISTHNDTKKDMGTLFPTKGMSEVQSMIC
jgi:hypothetical protein